MFVRATLVVVPAVLAVLLAGVAQGNPSGRTDMEQAKAAGWDCNPEVPIAGPYLHCAPPGKPSVADIVTPPGSTVPSIELRVFNLDGSFAGIESLIRADLYQGQRCPQDDLVEWGLLDLPGADYRACHRFDT